MYVTIVPVVDESLHGESLEIPERIVDAGDAGVVPPRARARGTRALGCGDES
jgi:hypothetical protein